MTFLSPPQSRSPDPPSWFRLRPWHLAAALAVGTLLTLGSGYIHAFSLSDIGLSPIFAEERAWWNPWRYLTGLNSRSKVVPFCMVVMAIALFVMIKKFADPGRRAGFRRAPVRTTNETTGESTGVEK
jgi:hypothetical protein